jgi:trimethyllysine dioxygenase
MSARPIEERAALEVEWERGTRSRYHNVWLRDHCQCAECINETTRQRQVCSASIPEDLVVASASLTSLGEAAMDPTIDSGDADVLRLDWSSATDAGAAHRGHISVDWLQRNAYWHVDVEGEDVAGGDDAPPLASSAHDESGAQRVVLWDADFDSRAAEVQYDSILRDDETLRASMNLLHTLGFALVKGTPETVAATELVAKRMCGYVRQTLYGGFSAPHYGMWDTAPKEGTEVNDTAFTNVALPPHNDGCYWRDPPGLQLFNCAERSEDTKGGLTVLVDGFRVADELRASDPDTFQFFIKTVRRRIRRSAWCWHRRVSASFVLTHAHHLSPSLALFFSSSFSFRATSNFRTFASTKGCACGPWHLCLSSITTER